MGSFPASLQAASSTVAILRGLHNLETYKSQIQNKTFKSYIKNIPKLQLCRTFEILVLCAFTGIVFKALQVHGKLVSFMTRYTCNYIQDWRALQQVVKTFCWTEQIILEHKVTFHIIQPYLFGTLQVAKRPRTQFL